MQQAIDAAYLQLRANKSNVYSLHDVEYQHTPMKNLQLPATDIMPTEFAYFSLIAILLPCITGILIPLVEEKQDGVKVIFRY